jgi:hypothetical protein
MLRDALAVVALYEAGALFSAGDVRANSFPAMVFVGVAAWLGVLRRGGAAAYAILMAVAACCLQVFLLWMIARPDLGWVFDRVHSVAIF